MTDPTNVPESQIDKALGEDWPAKRRYPLPVCQDCSKECYTFSELPGDQPGTLQLWCFCTKCEIETFHPIPVGAEKTDTAAKTKDDFGGKIFRSSQEADAYAELREDRARLDWLIKQGPPGAAPSIGLTEETWEIATAHAGDDDCETDAMAVRAAIDAARKP